MKKTNSKFPDLGIVTYLRFDFAEKKNLPLFQSILFKPSDDVYNFLAMITIGIGFRWQKEIDLNNIRLSFLPVRLHKIISLDKTGKKGLSEEEKSVSYWKRLLDKPKEFWLAVAREEDGSYWSVELLPVHANEIEIQKFLKKSGQKEIGLYVVEDAAFEVPFTPGEVKNYLNKFTTGSKK